MQVREIMTENPACCTPDSNLQEVARMMVINDCGCIPVVESQSRKKPVGTITDRDITIRTVAANQNPLDMKASDIMTTDIATITPQTSIEECFNVMEDKEIRRVLVVDENGSCCGIVAQADVVQHGSNPIRTTKLVREISESAPSRNTGISMGRQYRQYSSNNESFVNSGSILPLLLGLGSGAALMYLLSSERKTHQREHINHTVTHRQPTTVRHIDTQPSIDRSPNLSSNPQGLQTENREPIIGRVESPNESDTFVKNKGRSATPGTSF